MMKRKTLDDLKKAVGGVNTNGSPVLFRFTAAQLNDLLEIVRQEERQFCIAAISEIK